MDVNERLASGAPILLDGPMGTELDRRGADTALPLWSARALVQAPEIVRQIHVDYLEAGAEVVTTNTFRTHRRSLAKAGLGDRAAELTALAVSLAQEAVRPYRACADGPPWVAGSVAPLEDCYRPDLTPPHHELEREHREMTAALAQAGVDLLLVETMPTVREAVIAARAAAEQELPVWVGFTCDAEGRLLSGEPIATAAARAEAAGAAALLVNCTATPVLLRALARLADATTLPIGAYGNVGHAEGERGWAATEVLGPEPYCRHARTWLQLGARIVGSCCGTGPAHIRRLAALLSEPRRGPDTRRTGREHRAGREPG